MDFVSPRSGKYKPPKATKKNFRSKPDTPVPLPTRNNGLLGWKCYHGEWNGEYILVNEDHEAFLLYTMGCFGTDDSTYYTKQIVSEGELYTDTKPLKVCDIAGKVLPLGFRDLLHCENISLAAEGKNTLVLKHVALEESQTTDDVVLEEDDTIDPSSQLLESASLSHQQESENRTVHLHVPSDTCMSADDSGAYNVAGNELDDTDLGEDWRQLEQGEADPWDMDVDISVPVVVESSITKEMDVVCETSSTNVVTSQNIGDNNNSNALTACNVMSDRCDVTTDNDDQLCSSDAVAQSGNREEKQDSTGTAVHCEASKDDCTTTKYAGLDEKIESSGVVYSQNQTLTDKHAQHQITSIRLTTEEAFFLSYALGCLILKDKTQDKLLDILAMWQLFVSLDAFFVPKYIVYHHYRSRGWIVRDGIKFGVHYTLYKDGPAFYHASYSVLIKTVKRDEQGTLVADDRFRDSSMSWQQMFGCERVIKSTRKEMLLCFVILPEDSDINHPKCLHQASVQEVVVDRCVMSDQRENEIL